MTSDFSLPETPSEMRERLDAGGAVAWQQNVTIPTYEPAEPDRYPMFLDRRVYQGSSGRVYPIPFTDSIATESVPRSWAAVHLENRWIRLMVLPELGGRIHVGYDKTADYDFFYRNSVIKPALVGLAGPWISGGVEFNWPQHHRPATFLPTDVEIEYHDDGAVTVWCSDHDPFTRMKGMHGVRLHPDRAVVELVVRLHNRTSETQTFLWWANVAARVDDNYQSFFPTDVRYVADHARRAITSFPAADRPYYGVDYPARAADGGDRIDFYKNITVPTSYMIVDTKDDFFGGYDHAKGAGFVHVADRHIAPGKKQWTWGNAPFGHAWDALLTDEDGPYVELMAGVYTDNQPDFAWLQPGETKNFAQSWFPIQQIGVVHQANLEAAVHLDVADGVAGVGVCVTALRPGARVTVTARGETVLDWTGDLGPGQPYLAQPSVGEAQPNEVEIVVAHGDEVLLRWRPRRPEDHAAEPEVATEPPLPGEIESLDELYLTGVHLAQYRHPTRSPLPYWHEALRRDAGDARSNLALADDAYRHADYALAEEHARRALARLTRRNGTPRDGEVFYLLGLVLARTGRDSAAIDAFAKAAWDGRWAAPAALELARLQARAHDDSAALERIVAARRADPDDSRSRALQVLLLRRLGRAEEAAALLADTRAIDPLDQLARALDGAELSTDPHTVLDVARELAVAGEPDAALTLFERAASLPATPAGEIRPLAHYGRAVVLDGLGRHDDARDARAAARAADATRCFPAGLDDHDVLRAALAAEPDDLRARALLAMLLLDRARSAEALELWTSAIGEGLDDAVAFRNAAIVVFNLHGDGERALDWYDRAIALRPGDARLWYESDQLLVRLGAGAEERLARLEPQRATLLKRDDVTVEFCELLVETGRADEALAIMSARPFAPWEGGEGRTLRAWERVCLALAGAALDAGDAAGALSLGDQALLPPRSLGETRHPQASTAAIQELRAAALEALGRAEEAEDARADGRSNPVPAPADPDAPVDYFATSLPELLLFSRPAPVTTPVG